MNAAKAISATWHWLTVAGWGTRRDPEWSGRRANAGRDGLSPRDGNLVALGFIWMGEHCAALEMNPVAAAQ